MSTATYIACFPSIHDILRLVSEHYEPLVPYAGTVRLEFRNIRSNDRTVTNVYRALETKARSGSPYYTCPLFAAVQRSPRGAIKSRKHTAHRSTVLPFKLLRLSDPVTLYPDGQAYITQKTKSSRA
jgi:hypothetical protein